MSFDLRDMDEHSYPKRRPWLIVVALLCIVATVVFFRVRSRGHREEPQKSGVVKTERHAPAKRAKGAVAGPGPAASSADAADLMSKGQRLEEADDLLGARDCCLRVIRTFPESQERAEAEGRLGRLNIRLLFSPLPMPEKTNYVVRAGDSVPRIAKKYRTTDELIRKSNGLSNPNLIRPGDALSVFTGRFSIKVSKTRNDMVVSVDDCFFKRYAVGTGKQGKTPVGTFVVWNRIKEPPWDRPDGKHLPYGHPDNILGTRWMAIKATGSTPEVRGYGIHGCVDTSSIGKAESAGCIRMINSDVEELFAMIPVGVSVEIAE